MASIPASSDDDDDADDLKGIVVIDMYAYIGALSNIPPKDVEVACHLVGEKVDIFPKKKIKPYKVKLQASMDMALFTLKKAYVPLVMLKRLRTLQEFIKDAQGALLDNTIKQVVHYKKMTTFDFDSD